MSEKPPNLITFAVVVITTMMGVAVFRGLAIRDQQREILKPQLQREVAAAQLRDALAARANQLDNELDRQKRAFTEGATGEGYRQGSHYREPEMSTAEIFTELKSVKDQLKQATADAEAERVRRFEIEKAQLQAKNEQDRVRDIARIVFSLIIAPLAFYILISKNSKTGQRAVAGSALAALLGFWFAK
jgi:hypothetical protein